MMEIETELDHRIELLGVRLGHEPDGMRDRMRRYIEMEHECKRALERAEGYVRAAAWRERSDPPYEPGRACKDLAAIHNALSTK